MSTQPPQNIAELLALLMHEQRMSEEFLASELGGKRVTVKNLLSGQNKGTHPDMIRKLSRIFRVDETIFYAVSGQIPPDLRNYLRINWRVWDAIRAMQRNDEAAQAKADEDRTQHAARLATTFENGTPYARTPRNRD